MSAAARDLARAREGAVRKALQERGVAAARVLTAGEAKAGEAKAGEAKAAGGGGGLSADDGAAGGDGAGVAGLRDVQADTQSQLAAGVAASVSVTAS